MENYTSYIDLIIIQLMIVFNLQVATQHIMKGCNYSCVVISFSLLGIIQLYRSSTMNSLCILHDCYIVSH